MLKKKMKKKLFLSVLLCSFVFQVLRGRRSAPSRGSIHIPFVLVLVLDLFIFRPASFSRLTPEQKKKDAEQLCICVF